MENLEIKPDEVILFQGNARSKNYKGSLHITLTSERIIIDRKKGFFKVRYENLDTLMLNDLKIYNNKVQAKQRYSSVDVQTIHKNITLDFYGIVEATKFTSNITSTITNTTLTQRNTNRLTNGLNLVDNTLAMDSKRIVRNVIEIVITGILCNIFRKKEK